MRGFQAQSALQFGDLRAAAVNHHDAHAEVMQDARSARRARVESVSANTPPPAFTTKVLPLYMRMYGAALFSAAMARSLIGAIHHLQLPSVV